MDPFILYVLTRELSALKELRTVVEGADKLIAQTQRISPDFASDAEIAPEIKLASNLLNFAAKASPSLGDARKLLQGIQPLTEHTKIVAANGIHDLHRITSDKSILSNEARLQQTSVLQKRRSELSANEEAANAANSS